VRSFANDARAWSFWRGGRAVRRTRVRGDHGSGKLRYPGIVPKGTRPFCDKDGGGDEKDGDTNYPPSSFDTSLSVCWRITDVLVFVYDLTAIIIRVCDTSSLRYFRDPTYRRRSEWTAARLSR